LALAEVDREIAVGCASNSAYAMPLAVMLRSAAKNLSEGFTLHAYVVDDEIGDENRERIVDALPSNAIVSWVEAPRQRFQNLPLWGRMPVTTYYKMGIAELVPHEIDKLVWLDCDMLVLGDLCELLKESSVTHTLAAQDTLVPYVTSKFGVAGASDLGFDSTMSYFNAGMMVIDTTRWRDQHVADRAMKYLRKYGNRVFFWDQEALNAVLAGEWTVASPKWNWSATNDRTGLNSRKGDGDWLPSIIHFNGNIKPWTVANNDRASGMWLSYLDETPWKHRRPKRTIRGMLLSWYSTSDIRRLTYPIEQWRMQITHRLTQRYA
jgi:lipopolysaccharide biosynthesis glycosyltransferase